MGCRGLGDVGEHTEGVRSDNSHALRWGRELEVPPPMRSRNVIRRSYPYDLGIPHACSLMCFPVAVWIAVRGVKC